MNEGSSWFISGMRAARGQCTLSKCDAYLESATLPGHQNDEWV